MTHSWVTTNASIPFTPAQIFPISSTPFNNLKTRFFAKFGIMNFSENTSSNNVCGQPFCDMIELGVVDGEDAMLEFSVVDKIMTSV